MKVIKAKSGTDKEGKPYYKIIGRVITSKNGGEMIKIDVVPVAWDGWL